MIKNIGARNRVMENFLRAPITEKKRGGSIIVASALLNQSMRERGDCALAIVGTQHSIQRHRESKGTMYRFYENGTLAHEEEEGFYGDVFELIRSSF